MATYVTLLRFTQQGIQNIKQRPTRLKAAEAAFQAAGSELKQFYLTAGRYDAVIVSDVPDDETVAKLALGVGSQGNVRTDTLRAFTEDEYRKIIAALP